MYQYSGSLLIHGVSRATKKPNDIGMLMRLCLITGIMSTWVRAGLDYNLGSKKNSFPGRGEGGFSRGAALYYPLTPLCLSILR